MDEGLAEVLQLPISGVGTPVVLGTLLPNTFTEYFIAISNGVVAWNSLDPSVFPDNATFFSGPLGQHATQRFELPSLAMSGMLLDATGKTMYFVATGTAAYVLYTCTLATGVCTQTGTSGAFGSIAMNGTYVFWGNSVGNGSLNRLTLATGALATFTAGANVIPGIAGIALDATNVYWVAPGEGLGTAGILAMPQAGGTVKVVWSELTSTLASNESVPENSLVTDGKLLYFDVSSAIDYVPVTGATVASTIVTAPPSTGVSSPVWVNGTLYFENGSLNTINGVKTP